MKSLVHAAALIGLGLVVTPGHAAIAPFSSGNSELVLHVVDETVKISYVLDLGIYMGLDLGVGSTTLSNGVGTGNANDFIVIAQQDIGYQRFWVLDEATSLVWKNYLGLVDPAKLSWAVTAGDSLGGTNAAGLHRMLTTVKQGSESKISTFTNAQLTNALGSTQGGQFFGTVNAIGTAGKGSHAPQTDYTINGESYSSNSDSGFGYYGKSGGQTSNWNGNAPFAATNPVGTSSWFYYLQRSGSGNGSFVSIDEIDNMGADGYWGFVKVQGTDPLAVGYDPTSPYVGKYLLSFTLPVYDVRTTASFRTFAQGIDRTEFSGGMQITALDGVAAAGTKEAAAGWVTRLGTAGAEGQGLPALLQLTSRCPSPRPGRCGLQAWPSSRAGWPSAGRADPPLSAGRMVRSDHAVHACNILFADTVRMFRALLIALVCLGSTPLCAAQSAGSVQEARFDLLASMLKATRCCQSWSWRPRCCPSWARSAA